MTIASRKKLPLILGAIACCAATVGSAGAQPIEAPDQEALARGNGEPITLDDFLRQVNSFHADLGDPSQMVQRPDAAALLDRVINSTLMMQEAEAIGLGELPEVINRLQEGRLDLIRQRIAQAAVQDIVTGDPEVAQQLYRDAVREVKVQSVLFQDTEDASYFEAAIRGGGDFEAQAKRMVQQGKAQVSMSDDYLKASEMWPSVTEALTQMEAGGTSAPIPITGGLAVVKLLDSRIPEDAEARAEAEGQALTIRQMERLREYTEEMRGRYITADRELAESLDFDSTGVAGLEDFRNDQRVLAEVDGGEPITVAELTRTIEQELFHGMERALEQQRVNDEALGVLDRLTLERSAELEADRLGILASSEFQSSVEDLRETMIFAAFVSRVINPEIRLDEEELQAYYQDHLSDYTGPEMMRIDSLVFYEKADAEAALEKLRQGADIQWMGENASGQIPPGDDQPTLQFNRSLLAVPGLPAGVRSAVAGAAAGDFRFYGEPGRPSYALHIMETFPATPQSFDQVREQIAKQAFGRERQEAIDRYAEELRKASDIEILVTDDRLQLLLGLNPQENP